MMRPAIHPALLLLALLICITGCARDDAPERGPEVTATNGTTTVRAALNRATLRTGEVVILTVVAEAPPEVLVEFPAFLDARVGDFDLLDSALQPDIPLDTGRRWTSAYQLSTFDAGEAAIPALEVVLNPRDGASDDEPVTITTEPMTITVSSTVERERAALQPIHDRTTVPLPRDWTWVLGGGLLLAFVLAVLIVVSRWKRQISAEAEAAPVAPHVWAAEQFAGLEREGYVERGESEPFYVGLTGIVRTYVERRFHLTAPDQTTDEFLRDARTQRALTDQQRRDLAVFLRTADLVKFARVSPLPPEMNDAFAAARHFVAQTVPTDAALESGS